MEKKCSKSPKFRLFRFEKLKVKTNFFWTLRCCVENKKRLKFRICAKTWNVLFFLSTCSRAAIAIWPKLKILIFLDKIFKSSNTTRLPIDGRMSSRTFLLSLIYHSRHATATIIIYLFFFFRERSATDSQNNYYYEYYYCLQQSNIQCQCTCSMSVFSVLHANKRPSINGDEWWLFLSHLAESETRIAWRNNRIVFVEGKLLLSVQSVVRICIFVSCEGKACHTFINKSYIYYYNFYVMRMRTCMYSVYSIESALLSSIGHVSHGDNNWTHTRPWTHHHRKFYVL